MTDRSEGWYWFEPSNRDHAYPVYWDGTSWRTRPDGDRSLTLPETYIGDPIPQGPALPLDVIRDARAAGLHVAILWRADDDEARAYAHPDQDEHDGEPMRYVMESMESGPGGTVARGIAEVALRDAVDDAMDTYELAGEVDPDG